MARPGLCAIPRSQVIVESASAHFFGWRSGLLITVALFAWLRASLALDLLCWCRFLGRIPTFMSSLLSIWRIRTGTLLSQSLTDLGCAFSHVHQRRCR